MKTVLEHFTTIGIVLAVFALSYLFFFLIQKVEIWLKHLFHKPPCDAQNYGANHNFFH